MRKLIASSILLAAGTTTGQAAAAGYDTTISVGYATIVSDSEFGSGMGPDGFNIKGISRRSDLPIGFITSFTSTGSTTDYDVNTGIGVVVTNFDYSYKSLMIGPTYHPSDDITLYGMLGMAWSEGEISRLDASIDREAAAYGFGAQYRVIDQLVIDASYENSALNDIGSGFDSGTLTVGVGYTFR